MSSADDESEAELGMDRLLKTAGEKGSGAQGLICAGSATDPI